MTPPRISFGMIVLNGEPFLRYNLRALYPFAHQIVIAEGASPKATHAATADGHSLDDTLGIIRRFQAEEDPQRKVILVTAEDEGHPDGFWPGEKDEQSQAYARRATGDWLWQIDVDEFYHPDAMRRALAYLEAHPETTCLTFRGIHFWGGFDYTVEGGLFLHPRHQGELWGVYRRVFRWGPGYSYLTHRPPSVADATGAEITRRRMRCASALRGKPAIRLHHYFMVLPAQFERKGRYYERQGWAWERGRAAKNSRLLAEVGRENGLRVMDHHGTRNWVVPFRGEHPPQVRALIEDLGAGRVKLELRPTADLAALTADPAYRSATRRAAAAERLGVGWVNLTYILWYHPRRRLGRLLGAHLPGWLKLRLPSAVRARLGAGR